MLDVGLKRPLDAWAFCVQAKQLGVSADNAPKLAAARKRLETSLSVQHARIVLMVKRSRATVRRNGTLWKPPLDTWTTESSSTLEVSLGRHQTVKRIWTHRTGELSQLTVGLKRATGQLQITGTPAGAEVKVDGRTAGRLPLSKALTLAPGSTAWI